MLNTSVGLAQVHTMTIAILVIISIATYTSCSYSIVPFTDKLHLDTSSFVNDPLESSHSVIKDIPLSPISLKLTFNSLNVVLSVLLKQACTYN